MRRGAAMAGFFQRGYNLVEVMIVLVVVGLVIGASIVPLRSLWQADAYRSEEQAMQAIKDAVAGYALSRETIRREVAVVHSSGREIKFVIAAGRPYLPCPDVDSDGYEDRGEIAAPGAGTPMGNVRIVSGGDNPLLTKGNCALSRGLLPYKTLGVPPADRWGNRYTYEVDDVMGNAVYGFDQNSYPDAADPRLTAVLSPAAPGGGSVDTPGEYVYQSRLANVAVSVMVTGVLHEFGNKRRPKVVCGRNPAYCATLFVGATVSAPRTEAGKFLRQEGNPTYIARGRRVFASGEAVQEGAAYVVVSHGENGHGAVNHAASDNQAGGVARCNSPANKASRVPEPLSLEAANFPFNEDGALPAGFVHQCNPAMILNPVGGSGDYNVESGFFNVAARKTGFVTTGLGGMVFDDVVDWAMQGDLNTLLAQARKFPIEEAPLLYARR